MLVDLINTVETRRELLRLLLKNIKRVGSSIFQYDESLNFGARIVKSFVPSLISKDKEEDEELMELRRDVLHMFVTSHREILQSSEFWNTKDAEELSEGLLHFLDRKLGHEHFKKWYGSIPTNIKTQLDNALAHRSSVPELSSRKRTSSNVSGISIISTTSLLSTPGRRDSTNGKIKDDEVNRIHLEMISKLSQQCNHEFDNHKRFWNQHLETRNSAWRQWQSQCSILIEYLSRSEGFTKSEEQDDGDDDNDRKTKDHDETTNIPMRVEWWVDHFVECPGLTHRRLHSVMMTKESLKKYVPAENKRRGRGGSSSTSSMSRSPSPRKRSRKRVNSSGSYKSRDREMLVNINNKLRPILETGDVVKRFYNCKRIALTRPRKAMLLICDESLYVVDNLQISSSSETIEETGKKNDGQEDEETTLLAPSSFDDRHACRQWKVCDVNFISKRRQLLRSSALVFGCRPHSISGAYVSFLLFAFSFTIKHLPSRQILQHTI